MRLSYEKDKNSHNSNNEICLNTDSEDEEEENRKKLKNAQNAYTNNNQKFEQGKKSSGFGLSGRYFSEYAKTDMRDEEN